MLSKYNYYKLNYPSYLLLFKQGNFYLLFNDDAIILNKIMNYVIKDNNKYLKVGFPLNSLKKIETILIGHNINYIIINNDIIKHKFTHNTYSSYQSLIDNYYSIKERINHINALLNQRIDYLGINKVLDNMERVIYEG